MAAAPARAQGPSSPAALVDQLLAADRAFAAAAADRNLVDALVAMFREDVAMNWPKGFTSSASEARTILLTNAANATSRAEWWPLRGGVSADGTHGFTVGLMRITLADRTKVLPAKYIAYWIKDASGWKVAAYKRAPAGKGEQPRELMAPSLPAALVAPMSDAAVLAAHMASLRKAEQAFSDDAQVMGVGPAFVKWGRADATNMGDPANVGFTVGAEAIGNGIGAGGNSNEGTKIEWNADRALVASSGDLGVTFGFIHAKDGSRPPSPFFTIWRRDGPSAPWRYIAE